jgi:hypothetical protein
MVAAGFGAGESLGTAAWAAVTGSAPGLTGVAAAGLVAERRIWRATGPTRTLRPMTAPTAVAATANLLVGRDDFATDREVPPGVLGCGRAS